MKEVAEVLRRKGQLLINNMQTSIMFIRHNLPENASEERKAVAEAEIEGFNRSMKMVRETFELPEPHVFPEKEK